MKDSERSHIHIDPRIALYFEEWTKSKPDFDDILVPPEHQPLSPDDDDSINPDQGSSLLIGSSVKKPKLSAWDHLGLRELASLNENEIDQSLVGRPKFGPGTTEIAKDSTKDFRQELQEKRRLFSSIPR
jgi:hypothetical protein